MQGDSTCREGPAERIVPFIYDLLLYHLGPIVEFYTHLALILHVITPPFPPFVLDHTDGDRRLPQHFLFSQFATCIFFKLFFWYH